MLIIGLLGHQGVGKNYLAEYIYNIISEKNKKVIILAFADHFKIDCIAKHNIEYEKVFNNKDYETRQLLQKIGTEEGRNKYGLDIWINILYNWIKILNVRNKIDYFIISDVRFQNEVNWIKKLNGIVIKINAPNRHNKCLLKESENNREILNNIKNHKSEIEIENIINYDNIINNDYDDNINESINNIIDNIMNIIVK